MLNSRFVKALNFVITDKAGVFQHLLFNNYVYAQNLKTAAYGITGSVCCKKELFSLRYTRFSNFAVFDVLNKENQCI